MNILRDQSLQPYNTFGFIQSAEYFVELKNSDDTLAALEFCRKKNCQLTVIGDGSNLVVADNIPGLTVRMTNKCVDHHSDGNRQIVTVDAGLNWDTFVGMMVNAGAYGLENLSLIPGTVGAAPVQNIGAYGVEIANTILSVTCVDLDTQEICEMTVDDCGFSYRNSIFKQSSSIRGSAIRRGIHTPRYLITAVTFGLSDIFSPELSYEALLRFADQNALPAGNAAEIRALVIAVRQSKLPDPAALGNAGSFFKNPELTGEQARKFRASWPDAPCYPGGNGQYKIAAGWLIDQAGWRGFKEISGDVGVYDKQALVLVNHNSEHAEKLIKLAADIKSSVQEQFDITLEQEPRTIP